MIGEDGRGPESPDPAYQQILKGIPAADFSADELLYLPRNLRAHRLYGMSPVEQIALTVNIALRRDASTLDYYRAGSSPDAFATLPREWTADQIRSFQDYFDAPMSGNLARRRQTKFMPADFKLIEARQPPLKDQYDEWLARIICYAFSVPVSPFVSQVNRATGGRGTAAGGLAETATPPMRCLVRAQTPAFPSLRTKREHLLDRLRGLPTRADIHDLELRLGERMDSLAVRFDRAFDPHFS